MAGVRHSSDHRVWCILPSRQGEGASSTLSGVPKRGDGLIISTRAIALGVPTLSAAGRGVARDGSKRTGAFTTCVHTGFFDSQARTPARTGIRSPIVSSAAVSNFLTVGNAEAPSQGFCCASSNPGAVAAYLPFGGREQSPGARTT